MMRRALTHRFDREHPVKHRKAYVEACSTLCVCVPFFLGGCIGHQAALLSIIRVCQIDTKARPDFRLRDWTLGRWAYAGGQVGLWSQ
jgi:hypothetical protein